MLQMGTDGDARRRRQRQDDSDGDSDSDEGDARTGLRSLLPAAPEGEGSDEALPESDDEGKPQAAGAAASAAEVGPCTLGCPVPCARCMASAAAGCA